MITIYTDGSVYQNPGGPGGWAAVISCGEREWLRVGGAYATTNNRMELAGIIRSLGYVRTQFGLGRPVEIITDSRYAIRGCLRQSRRLKNAEMFDEYDNVACGMRVQFTWVKGHSGVAGNERADRAAGEAARMYWRMRYGVAYPGIGCMTDCISIRD